GGMVPTGVADKAPDRIARVVYIDAFAPKDGQSLFGDSAWAVPKRRPQPIKTFEEKIRLTSAKFPPRHYSYAKKNGPADVSRQSAERPRSEPGWTCHEIDASHNPHITCPDVLMALLTQIMTGK